MSESDKKRKGRIWYTIWPENGAPESFGPFEMKTTYYPHPKDDEEDEQEKKSA